MMICVKKNLVVKQITKFQTSCSYFPTKSLVLEGQHLKVVGISVAVIIAEAKVRHFPKKKHGKIGRFYQSFFSKIYPKISYEIGHYFRKFVSENPAKFDFSF